MPIKGLADALVIEGPKKKDAAEELEESEGSGVDMALDDAFDALKSGDRAAFRAAMKDFAEMSSAPAAEDEGDAGADLV